MSDTAQAEAADLPTADKLREGLLRRINDHVTRTGMTKSDIGKKAVNDVAFVSDLEAGRNITLKVYDRVLKFLDGDKSKPSPRRRP